MHRILLAPEVKGVDEASTHSAQSVVHGSHGNDYSKPVSELNCERCKAFFNKYVTISENAYQVLDVSTRTVSQKPWRAVFCGMTVKYCVSHHQNAAVPKTARANPQKFVKSHLYPHASRELQTQDMVL